MSAHTAKNKGLAPSGGPDLPCRLLVADDDQAMRALLAYHLRNAPWETVFAEDGLQAAALYEASSFGLVLLDLEMPGGGGQAAVLALRQVERAKDRPRVPILALSAHAAETGFELPEGFDGMIAKPFTAEGLLRAVQFHLPGDQGAVRSEGVGCTTDEALLHLMPQVTDSLAELGAEAAAALEAEDYGALGKAGHTMLGTASCFGLGEAVDIARDLELAAETKSAALATAALDRLPDVLGRLLS
ncbi:MAG: response regulator [Proteobacteria bacterium]|nr:response regulator [Pseudomonadota bacterium]